MRRWYALLALLLAYCGCGDDLPAQRWCGVVGAGDGSEVEVASEEIQDECLPPCPSADDPHPCGATLLGYEAYSCRVRRACVILGDPPRGERWGNVLGACVPECPAVP